MRKICSFSISVSFIISSSDTASGRMFGSVVVSKVESMYNIPTVKEIAKKT
jgi:hypothetical protein